MCQTPQIPVSEPVPTSPRAAVRMPMMMKRHPIYETADSCLWPINRILSIERVDRRARLVLAGFLATLLSPLFLVVYLVHAVYQLICMAVSLSGLIFMVFLGIPLLCIGRFVYAMYHCVLYVLMYFYVRTIGNWKMLAAEYTLRRSTARFIPENVARVSN